MAVLDPCGSLLLLLMVRDVTSFITTSLNHSKHLVSAADRYGDEQLSWGVHIKGDKLFSTRDIAEQIANEFDLVFHGSVARLPDIYRLSYRNGTVDGANDFAVLRNRIHDAFQADKRIVWFTQFVRLKRVGRSLPEWRKFNDPQFKNQWHLYNKKDQRYDINVTGVWSIYNITGRGVTVCIVDDGVEWRNPDLISRYEPDGSWDLNDDDPDPSPNPAKKSNQHGTRCAGEVVAAANNSFCGVGVAYGGKISGIRLLDGPITDDLEAEAFSYELDINYVENLSWGPSDDGKTIDAPHVLAQKALQRGVSLGRHGFGTVYVIPGGNGGMHKDNCNYDGYANSIYTITINAVDEKGRTPFYAELCAASLVSTFSGGNTMFLRRITTTDWDFDGGKGCTNQMSGTSASTPIAAGIIALMLEAKPCLSYRDIKYILILTAKKIDDIDGQWIQNDAGLHHNHFIGFGIMDAFRAVTVTKIWTPVPIQVAYSYRTQIVNKILPKYPMEYAGSVVVKRDDLIGIRLLEYVQVTVTVKTYRRGNLVIYLECPSGTRSILTSIRPKDETKFGLTGWTMTTARCWGERPEGQYTITIIDNDKESHYQYGQVVSWRLHLTGTPLTYEQFQEKKRLVMDTIAAGFVNVSDETPCWKPPMAPDLNELEPMSHRLLKMLAFTCIFCTTMLLYEIMEYMCCYGEEKQESSLQLRRVRRAQQLGLISIYGNCLDSETTINEQTRLLSSSGAQEDIAMHTIDSNHSDVNTVDLLSAEDRSFNDDTPPQSGPTTDDGFVDLESSTESSECVGNDATPDLLRTNMCNNSSQPSTSLSNISYTAELSLPKMCSKTSDDTSIVEMDACPSSDSGPIKTDECESVLESILSLPENDSLIGVDLLYGLSKEEIQLNMKLVKGS